MPFEQRRAVQYFGFLAFVVFYGAITALICSELFAFTQQRILEWAIGLVFGGKLLSAYQLMLSHLESPSQEKLGQPLFTSAAMFGFAVLLGSYVLSRHLFRSFDSEHEYSIALCNISVGYFIRSTISAWSPKARLEKS